MISFSECFKENLCVDCGAKNCSNAGDKIADCPRYPQTCQILKEIESCDKCTWIDEYIKEARKSYVRGIEHLDLSVGTYHCLKRAGIDTIRELESLMNSGKLASTRGVGKKLMCEITEKLEEAKRNGY